MFRCLLSLFGIVLLSGTAGCLQANNGVVAPLVQDQDSQSQNEEGGSGPKKDLILNEEGLCEWGLFKVDLYRATLYLEEKCKDPDKIINSNKAKSIHLCFVRSLTKGQLQKAYSAAFEANARESLPQYVKRLNQLNDMMEDVDKGDSLIISYVPGKGTEVQIKGRKKGKIKGADFGVMFFKLYLGEFPPSKELKNGLLGIKKGES